MLGPELQGLNYDIVSVSEDRFYRLSEQCRP